MRKLIALAIVGVLALAPTVMFSPSANAQVIDSVSEVCKIDGTWNFSESRAHSPVRVTDFVGSGLTLDITGDRTHDAASTVGGKIAGYVAITPTLLGDIDVASMDYLSSVGASPGYQLVVDRTPDDLTDGYDGILVGESVYGNVWWATKPTRWVGGPEDVTVGTNSDVDGTLADFAAFDPDAKVVAVGFSLGTLGVGTEAKGVLRTLTFNDTTWDFGLCSTETTTTTTTSSTTDISPTTTSTMTSETSSSSSSTSTPESTTSTTSSVLYENCEAVWAAIGRSLLAGEPGYRLELDGDQDGVACDNMPTPTSQGVVPVGNTDNLANTGTSGIGAYLAIAGFLIALGIASFIGLKVQRKRERT